MYRARLPAAALLFATLALAACGGKTAPPTIESTTFAAALGVDLTKSTKLASGVYIRDEIVGTGALVNTGDVLEVDYTGWLPNGTQFDSVPTHPGFLFGLGANTAPVPGWDLGIAGMKIGGKRQIIIPFELAYGEQSIFGYDVPLPPESILVYEITVLSVQTLESVTYDPSLHVDLTNGTFTKLSSGMYIHDTTVGTGAAIAANQTVTANYTLWLTNGTKVESSTDPNGKPISFKYGAGAVIKGWDFGLFGMNVGGTRQLVIPPELGYGASGSASGSIGPYTILVFSVTILSAN